MDSKPKITIYAIPGSQFTGKVLVALDSRKIEHSCVFVATQPEDRRTQIPSGGTMVPEMEVVIQNGDDDKNPDITVVPDSEAILHWFDDHLSTEFFPKNTMASELSTRASDKVLAGSVYYYNWVDEDGYQRSMKESIIRLFGLTWLPFIGYFVDWFIGSERIKYKKKASEALGRNLDDNSSSENKESSSSSTIIRQMLLDEVIYYQSFLLDNPIDKQPYILPGDKPTAVDFSVYVQMERLVGDMGDVKVPPALPQFKEETSKDLTRFWEWYNLMRERHPIKFKGKRISKAKA